MRRIYAKPESHWGRRILIALILIVIVLPVAYITVCRFVPVPGTPQMALYFVTGRPVDQHWRPISQISPALQHAVLASEDEKFCYHHGFDVETIERVLKSQGKNPQKRLRGASTISQQAARIVFLLPVRSWIRKGMEAYFTVLIEAIWPKKRILAVYLNYVDWGDGHFGAEAAAQAYFHKPASRLTALEAARLATILPNPDKWKANPPGPYVRKRAYTVLARARFVHREALDMCLRK